MEIADATGKELDWVGKLLAVQRKEGKLPKTDEQKFLEKLKRKVRRKKWK